MVLVIAPLMCIICDNPRASELLNHLGSSALKYCRVCMVSKIMCVHHIFFICPPVFLKCDNPDELSELRTMALALQQIAEIAALWTKQEKIETRTLNPLFSIHADLYRYEKKNILHYYFYVQIFFFSCLSIEVLHTLLLGICRIICSPEGRNPCMCKII